MPPRTQRRKNLGSRIWVMSKASIGEQLNRAAWLFRNGRFDEAQRVCKAILEKDSHCSPAFLMLAIIALRRGNPSDAIKLIDRSLLFRPDDPEALNQRGAALFTLNRHEQALASYDKAIALNPGYAEALNNRGSVLGMLGRDAEALASLDRALAVRPDYVDALINRGFVLHRMQRYGEALASYDRALAIRNDVFDALLNRGLTLAALDRHDEALVSYDKALALCPGEPDALLNRGSALIQLNRAEEATACCQQLVAANPDDAEARLTLCMAQLPMVYRSEPEIDRFRASYEQHLKSLNDYAGRGDGLQKLATVMGNWQPYYLPYQGQNDRDLQSIYGTLFCRAMAVRFGAATLPGAPAPDAPVKVGIVSGFFREHAIWRIPTKGWISQIDRKNFRIFGYYTRLDRDAETDIAAGLCDHFIQGPLSLARWRETILADAPHVLIFPEIGMDRVSAQLAAQRLAPTQCNALGHPVTSGFPTLDYALSSDLMEPPGAEDLYTERLIRLPNLSVYYEPAEASSIRLSREELGLRADATVFWCGQSLFKYLPQFDQVFPRIAREVPYCQFAFIEAYGIARPIAQLFRQRLAAAFAACGQDPARHFVFLPRMNRQRFAAAIGRCDIILDSIGWSGNNSTMEGLPTGLPVVTMNGAFMRGRHTSAILRMIGVTDTIADSIDDYVRIAVRLAKDVQWRTAARSRMLDNQHLAYRDRTCISALEDFLNRVARGGGAVR